jgi:hypothetical protein
MGCSAAVPTGNLPVDSGTQRMEVGASPADADAAPVDAGAPPVDAGAPPVDAGAPPVDAGGPMALDGGGSIQALPYTTNDLVFDPKRHVLYASLDAMPAAGHGVLIIDPATATVTGAFPVDGFPSFLAISDDASALYVGITTAGNPAGAFWEVDGGDSVSRIDLASMTVGPPVSMGTFRTAGQIAAVPGSSTQYVVSRRQPGVTPDFAGLALYDGAMLLTETSIVLGGDAIAFSNPSTLFAFADESPSDFMRLSVTPTAITAGKDVRGLIDSGNPRMIVNGGLIFVNDGHVVSAATMAALGSYNSSASLLSGGAVPASAAFLPDADGANVWFVHNDQNGFFFLFDFDRATFLLRRKISLALVMGDYDLANARPLVQWSPTGLAFRTFNAVYLLTVPN